LLSLAGGPFGVSHLHELADAVLSGKLPQFSPLASLTRNLMLMPVVLVHGFTRLFQRWLSPGSLLAEDARVVHPEP
jgi:hypothetical protein